MGIGRLGTFAVATLVVACATPPAAQFELPPAPNPPLARYAHSFPAFSIQYPESWNRAEPRRPNAVFRAEAARRLPALEVSVIARPPQLSLHQTTTGALAPILGVNAYVEILLDQEARLRDGKRAREAHLGMALEDGVSVDIVALSIYHGSRWVLVTVTGPAAGEQAREWMRRIAFSLSVDGS